MAKTLLEYIQWLDDRELRWPEPPPVKPAGAKPSIKPLEGIRAVTWNVYGTLLRINDGEQLFLHPNELNNKIAFQKMIEEFNLWQSMTRKPGDPWIQLLEMYRRQYDKQRLGKSAQKGDYPAIDGSLIWRMLLAQLGEKEYDYDMDFYGDPDEYSDKMAYFYHANLQGAEAAPGARDILCTLGDSPQIIQTLLADAQAFTIVQLMHCLKRQGSVPALGALFDITSLSLSFQEGIRKPSRSLFQKCVQGLAGKGIQPQQILHISSRLGDDLAVAKQFGMKTALYAEDILGLRAKKSQIQDPKIRPDRLLTELGQLRSVLNL